MLLGIEETETQITWSLNGKGKEPPLDASSCLAELRTALRREDIFHGGDFPSL